jgi:hypothetical protein
MNHRTPMRILPREIEERCTNGNLKNADMYPSTMNRGRCIDGNLRTGSIAAVHGVEALADRLVGVSLVCAGTSDVMFSLHRQVMMDQLLVLVELLIRVDGEIGKNIGNNLVVVVVKDLGLVDVGTVVLAHIKLPAVSGSA